MIAFSCPNCGIKLQVKSEDAGRPSRCPACRHPLAIPPADRTLAHVPSGPVAGTPGSLAGAGIHGDVTLDPGADPEPGCKPIRDLLAGRDDADGRYVVGEEIARGGMGAVLRAVDRDVRREVAVKFLLDQADPQKKLRFVEEAQVTGQLEHPNIVPVHELGVDAQGRLFFAMKMVRGRSLAQVLDHLRQDPQAAEKEYPLVRLLNVLVSVCNALAYAHSRGVVHRDLKPANVMVGDFGEVYVMDWGLAKVLQGGQAAMSSPAAGPQDQGDSATRPGQVATSRQGEADLTQEGAILGTPAYMPPEQAAGRLDAIDRRSDVYSLGAILYEMLTLEPPVGREGGYLAVLMRAAEGEVVPPERRAPARTGRIPRELSAVAMKALAKDPQGRYQSVEALRRDVELHLEGRSVSAREDTFREAAWKLVKRNKGASTATAIGLAVLAVVVGVGFFAVNKARLRAEEARQQAERSNDAFLAEQKARQERAAEAAAFFLRDAKASADGKQFKPALAQVEVALEYSPDLAEARLLKGQLLIVSRDSTAAAVELERYLRDRPGDGEAARLLDLCKKVRAEDGSGSAPFVEVFVRQKAFSLAEQMEQDRDELLRLYRKRIDAAWPGLGNRLFLNPDGRCRLGLTGCVQVTDLGPLRGLPLDALELGGCVEVRDLSPLQGMSLTRLNLDRCGKVRDLSPLRGMPLTWLRVESRGVTDLGPLKGMPLTSLHLQGSGVSDLTPLRGMPLTSLFLSWSYGVGDIRPLEGMKLTSLHLQSTGVADLSPLKGMPLVWLNVDGWGVKDLTPLQGMNLDEVSIPRDPTRIARGMSVLREMKSLRKINGLAADDFWKSSPAEQPGK